MNDRMNYKYKNSRLRTVKWIILQRRIRSNKKNGEEKIIFLEIFIGSKVNVEYIIK